MIYTETQVPRRAYWLLAGLFLVLFVLYLPTVPLSPREAGAASIAARLWVHDGAAAAVLRGTRLHPLAIRLFALIAGGVNEWSVRLPGVFGVLAMCVVTLRVTRREEGRMAGAVAGAAVMSTALVIWQARFAAGQTLAASLVAAAWLSFYWLGRVRRRWSLMWVVALLLVLLASLETGLRTFVVFYFPLCFMRRPLRIWQRVLNPVHITALAVALVAHRFWFHTGVEASAVAVAAVAPVAQSGSYLGGLVAYPFWCLCLALPWPLLAWPGFCAAYRPLEKRSVFTSFLRTLMVPLFLLAWLVPGMRAAALLPLICPFAALTGVHYEVLVRRHGRELDGILSLIRFAVGVVGSLAVVGALLHGTKVLQLAELRQDAWLLAMGALLGALLLVRFAEVKSPGRGLWLRLAVAFTAGAVVLGTLYCTLAPIYLFPQRDNGKALAAGVPAGAPVYDLTAAALPAELFYLGHPVRHIASADDLPADEPAVYVLGRARPPVLETRTWTECSRGVRLGERPEPVLRWRPESGVLARVELTWEEVPLGKDSLVRMYRGVRRSPAGAP